MKNSFLSECLQTNLYVGSQQTLIHLSPIHKQRFWLYIHDFQFGIYIWPYSCMKTGKRKHGRRAVAKVYKWCWRHTTKRCLNHACSCAQHNGRPLRFTDHWLLCKYHYIIKWHVIEEQLIHFSCSLSAESRAFARVLVVVLIEKFCNVWRLLHTGVSMYATLIKIMFSKHDF